MVLDNVNKSPDCIIVGLVSNEDDIVGVVCNTGGLVEVVCDRGGIVGVVCNKGVDLAPRINSEFMSFCIPCTCSFKWSCFSSYV